MAFWDASLGTTTRGHVFCGILPRMSCTPKIIGIRQLRNYLIVKDSRACKLKGLSDPNRLRFELGRLFSARELSIVNGSSCRAVARSGIGGLHRVRLHERSGFP